ncbi:MAG: deoxyribose-phosphate aldolase, partial [Desulfocapsaceae bacterium]
VKVMLEAGEGRIKVKASGGIRDYAQAKAYIEMGVRRLGVGYPALSAICDGAPSSRESSDSDY